MEVKLYTVDEDIDREVRAQFEQAIRDAVSIEKKLERYGKIDELTEEAVAVLMLRNMKNEAAKAKVLKNRSATVLGRRGAPLIIEDKVRPDVKVDEIRPLIPRLTSCQEHTAVLFTRGKHRC